MIGMVISIEDVSTMSAVSVGTISVIGVYPLLLDTNKEKYFEHQFYYPNAGTKILLGNYAVQEIISCLIRMGMAFTCNSSSHNQNTPCTGHKPQDQVKFSQQSHTCTTEPQLLQLCQLQLKCLFLNWPTILL